MNKPLSQKARILAFMKRGKRITQRDAIFLYNCYRLASRIAELRAGGWNIKTKLVPNDNGSRHAQYYIGKPHRAKGGRA